LKRAKLDPAYLDQLRAALPGLPIAANEVAVIPKAEYNSWAEHFKSLHQAALGYFKTSERTRRALDTTPSIQWVAKLNNGPASYLVPKIYNVNFIMNGTLVHGGYQSLALPLLDLVATALPFKAHRWLPARSQDFLGLLPNLRTESQPEAYERYLPLAMDTTDDSAAALPINLSYDNKIDLLVEYKGARYDGLLLTRQFYEDPTTQQNVTVLERLKLLAIPKNYPALQLKGFFGFEHPSWASLFSLGQGLKEMRQDSRYGLIRTDTHTFHTWDEVDASPSLKLELEMRDFWLWQERFTFGQDSLAELDLYWVPSLGYPWLVNRQDNTWLPAIIVEEEKKHG